MWANHQPVAERFRGREAPWGERSGPTAARGTRCEPGSAGERSEPLVGFARLEEPGEFGFHRVLRPGADDPSLFLTFMKQDHRRDTHDVVLCRE